MLLQAGLERKSTETILCFVNWLSVNRCTQTSGVNLYFSLVNLINKYQKCTGLIIESHPCIPFYISSVLLCLPQYISVSCEFILSDVLFYKLVCYIDIDLFAS